MKNYNCRQFTFAFILCVAFIASMGCESRDQLTGTPFSAEGLRYASRDGRLERVQRAIDSGTDVDEPDPEGMTALLLAASGGHTDVVQLLLKHNADIQHVDNTGATALLLAAFSGHTDTIQLLLKNGSDVNHVNKAGCTALIYAASDKNLDTLQLLIDSGIKIDATENTEGFTALMFAAADGELEATKLLLAANANAALQDVDGDTAESFALKNGHQMVADLFQNQAIDSSQPKTDSPTK